MDTHFNYVHVSASQRLEEFTKEKLQKLKDHYDFVVSADIYFKTENSTANDQGRICEIKLSLPGPRIFASTNEENFEKAVYKTVSDLRRQLKRKKEKMKSHV